MSVRWTSGWECDLAGYEGIAWAAMALSEFVVMVLGSR